MEARIFFPSLDDKQSSSTTLVDLSNPSTVQKITANAPNLFGDSSLQQQEAANKIVASFSSSKNNAKPELRTDLYLVLPPSICGNYIGLKWRGKSEEYIDILEDEANNKNNDKNSEAMMRLKVISSLLSSSAEVKLSPIAGAGEKEQIPKPRIVQDWTKYRLSGFERVETVRTSSISGTEVSGDAVNNLRTMFRTSLAKTLEKLAKSVQPEHALPLTLAATRLLSSCSTSSQDFALVSVKKKRVKTHMSASKTSWDLEQTDMMVNDVTSKVFPSSTSSSSLSSSSSIFTCRSWCTEPVVLFAKNEEKYFNLASEFIQACAIVGSVNDKAKIASYPQFLAESLFPSN